VNKDRSKIESHGLAYDDVGEGPAVVLVHGYPFNRSMWTEQIAALKSHYRVLAIDLRGHGETAVTPGTSAMEDMAYDIANLLDHLEVSRAVIVGLSMGGYVALAFTRLFSLRVRGLVLADTRAQADTEEGKQTRMTQVEKILREGMEGIADAMLPKLLTAETVAKRPDIVRRVRDMMVQTPPEGAAAALRGMAQRRDQRPFLPNILPPTLILVGREDAITPVADSEYMHQEISGSRLEIIDGAGHVSNMERPTQFNDALLKFLQDIEA
jgi:3-oxoadipate enol-lactonase